MLQITNNPANTSLLKIGLSEHDDIFITLGCDKFLAWLYKAVSESLKRDLTEQPRRPKY